MCGDKGQSPASVDTLSITRQGPASPAPQARRGMLPFSFFPPSALRGATRIHLRSLLLCRIVVFAPFLLDLALPTLTCSSIQHHVTTPPPRWHVTL